MINNTETNAFNNVGMYTCMYTHTHTHTRTNTQAHNPVVRDEELTRANV